MRLVRPVTDGPDGVAAVEVDVVTPSQAVRRTDVVTVEEPLQIRLAHGAADAPSETDIAVTMRTPGDDTALALGFLHTEGIVDSVAQVTSLEEEENVVTVTLDPAARFEPEALRRNTYATSSCGICGKASIEAVHVRIPDRAGGDRFVVDGSTLDRLPAALQASQEAFAQTGGIHAAASFDATGRIDRLAEDVGRHNALDKLIGGYFADDALPLTGFGLLFSGRASFELVQKAAVAGCPFVAAIGPPSSLAVELAAEQRMTLVGFLRDGRFNIYTLPHRVTPGG